MLDPDVAAMLGALALGVLLTARGLRRAVRQAGSLCAACGRRILLGERTCDCDS